MRLAPRGVNRHHPNRLFARVINARRSDRTLTLPDAGTPGLTTEVTGDDGTTDTQEKGTSPASGSCRRRLIPLGREGGQS